MKFTIEMNIHELSRSITAGTLETLVTDIKDFETEANKKPVETKPEETKEEKIEATPEPAPDISETEIRAKFVELSKRGKKAELKKLLSKMKVSKVSDLKPEQYSEAMKELEAM